MSPALTPQRPLTPNATSTENTSQLNLVSQQSNLPDQLNVGEIAKEYTVPNASDFPSISFIDDSSKIAAPTPAEVQQQLLKDAQRDACEASDEVLADDGAQQNNAVCTDSDENDKTTSEKDVEIVSDSPAVGNITPEIKAETIEQQPTEENSLKKADTAQANNAENAKPTTADLLKLFKGEISTADTSAETDGSTVVHLQSKNRMQNKAYFKF